MRFPTAALGLVAMLAGCAGPTVVSEGDPYTRIDDLYAYGVGARDIRLEVRGNPFGGTDQSFARDVEAAARAAVAPRLATRPSLAPDASARAGYAIVLAFDPAPDLTGDSLCADQAAASAPPPAAIAAVAVEAAFCISGRAYTAVHGETVAAGAGDARLAALVREIIPALFRSDIPETGGGVRHHA